MKKLSGLWLALAALLLASCAAGGNSFTQMVPDNALMFAYVEDTDALLAKADGFMAASGLSAMTGGQKIEALLQMGGNIDLAKARESIDFKKPAGIILMGDDLNNPQVSILLPVKNADGAKTWISEATGADSSITFDGPVNNYLIMRPTNQPAQVWPPKKAIDPAILGQHPSHHVVLGLQYNVLMANKDVAESMQEIMGSEEALGPMVMDVASSIGWFVLSAGVDEKAVVMKGSMQINPATEYGKVVTGVSGAKADASSLVAEELFGMSADMQIKDPAAYASYMQKMLKAFKLEGAELDTIVNSMKVLMANQGGKTWLSLDADIPADMDSPEALSKLGLKVVASTTVKDSNAVRSETDAILVALGKILTPLVNKLVADQTAREMYLSDDGNYSENGYWDEETGEWVSTAGYYDEETGEWVPMESEPDIPFPEMGDEAPVEVAPTEVGLAFDIKKDQGDATKHDIYNLAITVNGGDSSLLNEVTIPVLSRIFETRVAYKDGKALMAMGTDSLANLEALASGKALGTKLADVPGFGELVAYLDADGQSIIHVSVARIINKVSAASGNATSIDEKVPGLLMTSSVKGNAVTFSAAFGAKELNGYLMQILPMLMGMFN